MMRSLSSGVAGLRTHQTKMDVVGNNIANVNTYGFKASRTTFADVYYQNLGGASSGTQGVQGGKNPTQIGYGSSVATIDIMNTVSSATSTGREMDIFIAGDGFLACKDVSGKVSYTRFGNLGFDAAGNLVDGNGNLIQGFPMKVDDNGNRVPNINPDGTIAAADLININCDPAILDKLTGISISTTGAIVGMLQGDKIIKAATVPEYIEKDSISINGDSNYIGDVKLTIGALPDAAEIAAALSGSTLTTYSPTVTDVAFGDVGLPDGATYTMAIDGKNITLTVNDPNDSSNNATYEGTVQADGTVVLKSKSTGKTAMSFKLDSQPPSGTSSSGSTFPSMNVLKYQVTTRDQGENTVKLPAVPTILPTPGTKFDLPNLNGITITLDPSKPGGIKPTYVTVGTAGYADDELYAIGNLALAKFRNPNGMSEAGSSYFTETANSGSPVFVKPGIEGTGETNAGYLESSNVDLSQEMTDMITTQRGFQANSRIITVSDTMLEELVNLKR